MPFEENIDDSGSIASEDYEVDDDDVRDPTLTMPVGATSQVAFLERKQLNSLIQFLSPIKCPVPNCEEDVMSIQINDWSMTNSIQFICSNNHKTS